jgi:hypothetical protein
MGKRMAARSLYPSMPEVSMKPEEKDIDNKAKIVYNRGRKNTKKHQNRCAGRGRS